MKKQKYPKITIKDLVKIFAKLSAKEKKIVNYFLQNLSHLSDYNNEENKKTTIEEINYMQDKLVFFQKNSVARKKDPQNYINALEFFQKKMQEKKLLDLSMIRTAFQKYQLVEKKEQGIFRIKDNIIIGNSDIKLVKVSLIRKHLNNFIDNFNNRKNQTNLLAKNMLLHHYFELIHPFNDGNGRMGRLLMIIFWQEAKLWPKNIACLLSYVVKTERNNYYAGLEYLSNQLINKEKNQVLIAKVNEINRFSYRKFLQEYEIDVEFYLEEKMLPYYWKAIEQTYQFIVTYQKQKLLMQEKLQNLQKQKTFRLLKKRLDIIKKLVKYCFAEIILSYTQLAQKLAINRATLIKIVEASKLFKDVDSFHQGKGKPERKFGNKKIYQYFNKIKY